ncbi:protein Lilipod isoform X2 [Atheta coriaria]|uniref:protein Lilipod isoform X2 n=1 Tax=Dalotia coriaria TaxID=877792 RepID=UPI0031F3F75E
MDDAEEEFGDIREQIFHNNVREQIIFLLLFIILYVASFTLLERFKRRGVEDYYSTDKDEITVYRISTWLCTFALSISIGAVLLLPISIVSNEVLLLYPNSYYVKWLNISLIQGLWNYIFLFSFISLIIFLPFAYLFTESEGFFGHRRGLMGRIYETSVVLGLLALTMLGITFVMNAIINQHKSSFQIFLDLWSYHLPFLYSCISFVGVLMLLVCTPLGFARLFDVVGKFLVKPQFLRDINEEYESCALEEETLRRRLKHVQVSGDCYMSPTPMSLDGRPPVQDDEYGFPEGFLRQRNGELRSGLSRKLTEIEAKRKVLDKQRQTSWFRRNVLNPVAMLLLFSLTVLTVLIVIQNTIQLLIGMKALPLSSRQFTLGISSLSRLGLFGAIIEIVLILYLIVTSSVGLYSSPLMKNIRPRRQRTPFNLIIANCALVLILSSALPLLAKILGITNFDLLGDYGSIEWLGNFKIVLLYNLGFAGAATLCLFNKFTAKVRRELYARHRQDKHHYRCINEDNCKEFKQNSD